ncbi:hypothetical protein E2C01_043140 [Portunus trituberculatus]|uniref:Uncharacterized protein n=1 Tax=Portunus trituberculatus TaxID=210409 RepID=A0A5B7FNN3_PORTR|nr:hypothetical protein [Portunus trituberculatus]
MALEEFTGCLLVSVISRCQSGRYTERRRSRPTRLPKFPPKRRRETGSGSFHWGLQCRRPEIVISQIPYGHASTPPSLTPSFPLLPGSLHPRWHIVSAAATFSRRTRKVTRYGRMVPPPGTVLPSGTEAPRPCHRTHTHKYGGGEAGAMVLEWWQVRSGRAGQGWAGQGRRRGGKAGAVTLQVTLGVPPDATHRDRCLQSPLFL